MVYFRIYRQTLLNREAYSLDIYFFFGLEIVFGYIYSFLYIMTNLTLAVETNSDDCITNVKESDNLSADLKNSTRPTNLKDDHVPINNVKVASLSLNKPGQKTCWLLAEIHPCHLGKGEDTSANRKLRDEIRSRGRPNDDCGHIIGRALGGKMIDFNLFPQNRDINRGWKGWSNHWKTGIDFLIKTWLINPSLIAPKVEFEIRFYYNDQQFPDRPDHGKYLITFKSDGSEESKKVNQGEKEISTELYKELKGILMNTVDKEPDSLSSPNYEQCTAARVTKFHQLSIEQFRHFVFLLLNDYKNTAQQQHPHPPGASSAYPIEPAMLKFK